MGCGELLFTKEENTPSERMSTAEGRMWGLGASSFSSRIARF